MGRRDKGHRDRKTLSKGEFVATAADILADIQQTIFEKARKFRDENIVKIDSREDFYDYFTPNKKDKSEIHGGFALCHWDGSAETEAKIKDELSVTIRNIPETSEEEDGKCVITGKPSKKRVIFAKAY